MADLSRPQGLLLDFGGVVFETHKRPTGLDELAAHVRELLGRGGYERSLDELRAGLRSGFDALRHWKHASSRRPEPREMSHREIVADFLAADLPAGERALLTAEASGLLEATSLLISAHTVRPGIPDLLRYCEQESILVGIVSNAHSGRAHRRLLESHGLERFFAVQVYSDEVGIRKPHPGMIRIAAGALGLSPADTWYVGDTQDRDVAAGRRAGVGAVVLTRSRHTDSPPFAVAHTADAVFDDPRGLLCMLGSAPHSPGQSDQARVRPGRGALPRHAAAGALLIDHGGVISTTTPGTAELRRLVHEIADQLGRLPGDPVTGEEVGAAIATARALTGERKKERRRRFDEDGTPLAETTPRELWDAVSDALGGAHRAWFRAEAASLTARFGAAKSRRTLRPGIAELLRACRESAMPVVVVSNTVSGRAVRAECARHGIDADITAYVCSDETGVRKPDPAIIREALTIAGADPALTWFLGDKPENDAAGSLSAGIAHRILITGGASEEDSLTAALADGRATAVIDSPLQLIPLIRSRHAS